MWEMQRQGRREGALDVDLISNRLGEMTVFVVCSGLRAVGLDERVWTIFEGRGRPRLEADLISVLSTGEARGANSSLWVCGIRVRCAANGCAGALSCAFSLSVKFFPAHPAERFVLNGKVKVVSTRCVSECSGCYLSATRR